MSKEKTNLLMNFDFKFEAKHLLALLGFYSLVALVGAYVAQYGFDLQPCILCLYQRIPFFVVGLVVFVVLKFFKQERVQKLALIFCILMVFGNAVLASYHVGVEQKIFAGPTTCADTANLDEIQNVEELATAIAKTKAVKCDSPSFFFLGLSMAAWNVAYCLFLVISTLVLLVRSRK